MSKPIVSVYEQDTLSTGDTINGWTFEEGILSSFNHLKRKLPSGIYRLEYQSIRFGNLVGLIELPDVIIEILPKVDRSLDLFHTRLRWTKLLEQLDFLPYLGNLNPQLLMQPGKLTETLQQTFLSEVEHLVQRGLVKEYQSTQQQQPFLRGRLLLHEQVRTNLVHKHRFFVQSQSNSFNIQLNQRIKQGLTIVAKSLYLRAKSEELKYHFRNVADVPLNALNSTIKLNRTNQHYRVSLQLANLICDGYLGGTFAGDNFGFALLFEMSRVFEQVIHHHLLEMCREFQMKVQYQPVRPFWKTKNLRPDFLIETKSGRRIILDTKWKILNYLAPTDEDLRQIYTYTQVFSAQRGILLYPKFYNFRAVVKQFAGLETESTGEIQFISILEDITHQLKRILRVRL